ncbi:MAG: enoyl-CoA hydratase [Flavobacteriales bacterium TMED113]|nr:MAG: enoyl-CoA hydratase [Flavobacteriales bacterium TMED113]
MNKLNSTQLIIENNIALIKICREKQLNALNQAVLDELSLVLNDVQINSSVKAVIITGQGEKSFVAGADIKEFQNFSKEEGRLLAQNGQHNVFDKIENFSKPVIAAINGYALGGGLELALSCHIRVASENAKLGFPECSLGLIPGYGGTQRLGQIVGKGFAFEMILTGKMIDVNRAQNIGLVNQISQLESLIEDAKKIAKSCIKNSPKALSAAIKCINKSFYTDGYELEIKEFSELFENDEFKEGVLAFLEKRRPNF